MKTFVARTADQWREWLHEHHGSESEVWLIFHKQHTGLASIAYEDAVEPDQDSAKQEETKARRLKEAIRLLGAGKPLGLK